MKNNLILRFDEIDKTMTPVVGGKGANLGEMTLADLPVPPGFCLTTEVYDRFAEGLALESVTAEEAREMLSARALPAECREALQTALADFTAGTLFSVRSSATAEDLPYASFAGQQDTYLNVPMGALEEAIKNCFVSLYTDRAVSYRKQNGIEKPSMSVVVQKMVHSDTSGVMFSVDPVSGRRSTLVIDAIFGLGEAIVSGLVSPDHIEYDKKKNEIIRETTACKAFAIRPLPGGGTEREELNSTEPVLAKEQIAQLAELGKRLEAHYGMPQDVEWATQDGKLYCLQTRAITSLYPAPEPFADGKYHFLFNMGYQQMNPKAMPKMALDCLIGAVNLDDPDLLNYQPTLVYEVGQHFFVDFSLILGFKPAQKILLTRLMPATDPLAASAFQELLSRGQKLGHPDSKVRKLLGTAAKTAIRFAKADDPKAAAAESLERMQQRSDEVVKALENAPVNAQSMQTLFQNMLMIRTFADSFMPMVMNGVLALGRLEKLEEKMGCKGQWTRQLQVGNAGNVVTEMGLALGDLADLAAENEELRSLLETGGKGLHETLSSRDDAFGEAYRAFMRRYGFRCAGELDVSAPRYEEDPSLLAGQILTMAKSKKPGDHRRDYEEKNAQATSAGEALIRAVEKKLGKRQAKKAAALLKKYQAYYPLREHFKYFWMRNFGEARKLLLRVGKAMADKGQIEQAADIMHLHMKEVFAALESGEDLRSLVSERKVEFERVSRLTPPRIITSEGEVLMGGLSRDGVPEGAIVGVGVSPGTVEGKAKVVLDPKGAVVEKGEILVAPFTDPGWTPLFVDAAAVITEIGGMLTHGAVVAREYGIPGVVGVMDATKTIRTGQHIRVDGTSGIIEILEN